MAGDDFKSRLEALNGGPLQNLPNAVERLTDPDLELRRKLTRPKLRPGDRNRPSIITGPRLDDLTTIYAPKSIQRDLSIEEALPGLVRTTPHGEYLFMESDLLMIAPWMTDGVEKITAAFQFAVRAGRRLRTGGQRVQDAIFIDIETLGLAYEPLFLIGVLRVNDDGEFTCEQYFARHTKEEPAVLSAFSRLISGKSIVISFNGMSFDVPYIQERCQANDIDPPKFAGHLDMLVEARRRVARTVPNCKLTTLENYLCKRTRDGDIPGGKIPGAYNKFVVTGNAFQLPSILHHNLLDMVTTAELLVHFYGSS